MGRWRHGLLAGAVLVAGPRPAPADPLPRIPVKPAPCGPGGGLALPGSDTCVRIGGFVRAEAAGTRGTPAGPGIVPATRPHPGSRSWLRPEARIDAEARTQTPYGPVRAYVSVKAR